MKDELAYSANHIYREGYEDGKYDGAQEANQRIPKLIKEIHDHVWQQGVEWGRKEAISDALEILKTAHMIRTTEEDFCAKIEVPFYREVFRKIKEQGE